MNHRPTKLYPSLSAKKHWGSPSFLQLIKTRGELSHSDPAPVDPPRPCATPPALNLDVPAYKPEPKLLSNSETREVITPGVNSPWTRDVFHWSQRIATVNEAVFGNDGFKPCQKEIINAVLAGRNVFACMPTGAGKSLLYQLPAVVSQGVSLVVMPLVALIKDQIDYLESLKVRAKCLLGSQAPSEQAAIFNLLLTDQLQVLIFTPEKIALSDHFKDILTRKYSEGKLDRLVIDEAHCISTWGTDFRASYLKLAELTAAFPKLPVLCLTSTAPTKVREDIISRLSLKDPLCFLTSLNRPNLNYEVIKKADSVWNDAGKLIKTRFAGQSGIVYCLARNECESFAKKLRRQFQVSADAYHASMEDSERTRVQDEWLKGNILVVVATIAFGLGINKPDVRFVIHTTIPRSVNDYYQESGRAGRDGASADCITFYSYKDKSRLDFLLQNSQRSDLNHTYHELSKMIAYCEDRVACRREMMLAEFGERLSADDCSGHCDNCRASGKREVEDVTEIAAEIRNVVRDTFDLTLLQLIQFLTGKSTRETHHPGCGRFASIPVERLRRIINLMCASGALEHVPVHSSTLSYTILRTGGREVGKVALWDRSMEREEKDWETQEERKENEEKVGEDTYEGRLKRLSSCTE